MLYRREQILVILSDQCFQSYIWPVNQFYGGILLISLLYSLLVFQHQLPFSGVILIGLFFLSLTFICCSTLHMGNNLRTAATKILLNLKKRSDSRWARKFLKSCPIIAIRVGEFHKMDRERVPSFIRFIMQRTFLLVLKTKLGLTQATTVEME